MTDRRVNGRGTASAPELPDGIPDDGTVPRPGSIPNISASSGCPGSRRRRACAQATAWWSTFPGERPPRAPPSWSVTPTGSTSGASKRPTGSGAGAAGETGKLWDLNLLAFQRAANRSGGAAIHLRMRTTALSEQPGLTAR